ncbi:MFS transporter [Streptomyces sp. NPDC005808]|uniref:MFS transporter n=1 Tax=Streptomyces sp. NPDC005808 TaxID=3364734 RepID=UPI0036B18ABB
MSDLDEGNDESGERTSSVRWAVGSLALSMLLSSLGTSIANVALPTLTNAFAVSFQEVQWVVLSYLLAITVLIVSAGRLGDVLGHRRVLLAGIAVFTVASILCGVAPTLWMLIAARILQGVGAAVLMALTMALVRETVPAARTGRAMGLLGTMSAAGTALGPSLGGILIAGPGWQAIFLVMAPLGIVNFLLAHRHLPVDRQKPKLDRQKAKVGRSGRSGWRRRSGRSSWSGFDGLGTLLLGLTLASYALAVTVGGGRFDRLNVALLSAAAVGVCLFVRAEARAASPLIRLAAFRNVVLSTGLAMNVLVATVMMTTLVVGPFYLSGGLGLNEALVGIVMSSGPVISALSGVPAGRVVDRLGAPFMVVAGLVAMAAGCVALSTLPAIWGLVGYVAALAVLTPGYQLFLATNNTAVMMDVHPDQRGVISGILGLSRNLGLITGASVMGAVFAFASAAGDITTAGSEAVATGMRITFAVSAVLIVVAVVLSVGSRAFSTRPSPVGEPS